MSSSIAHTAAFKTDPTLAAVFGTEEGAPVPVGLIGADPEVLLSPVGSDVLYVPLPPVRPAVGYKVDEVFWPAHFIWKLTQKIRVLLGKCTTKLLSPMYAGFPGDRERYGSWNLRIVSIF
jgi:hypothetical protein